MVQREFRNRKDIEITLVSQDNFFFYTPMLPEMASGAIETRHIVTPIRAFCKQAKFYEADVKMIDLEKKEVVIAHAMNEGELTSSVDSHTLAYDYLVLSLGSESNFFGLTDVARSAFTIKSLGDAIVIRNHIIDMLEKAELEHENVDLKNKLLTFVIVGGGFAGVETAGALNDFIRDSIRDFYHSLDESKDVRIVLVNAGPRLLHEVSEELGNFAEQKLRERGVEIIQNTPVTGVKHNTIMLKDGYQIPTFSLIWAGGVIPEKLIKDLPCDHDRSGKVVVNEYLQIRQYPGVFALGDCASITDPHSGKPYPPTAQHAIRQGSVAAKNLITLTKSGRGPAEGDESRKNLVPFDYKTRGMMATIGKRTGVGVLMGTKVHGFIAWWIWRTYYLARLPTTEKKLRVMFDWTMDMLFKPDVTRLKTFTERKNVDDLMLR